MRGKGWIPLFLLPAVLLFLFVFAVPLGIVFFTSTFDYRIFPDRFNFIGVEHFVQLFTKDRAFRQALVNTVIWIVLHCTLHVGLGVLLAMMLYKKPRGWKFVRVTYMIPSIIANAAIAMIFINIYNPQFGVLNSILDKLGQAHLTRNWLFEKGTSFASVTTIWTIFAGYTTVLVLAQALSVDEAIIEAARVDGASAIQTDWFIMLPLVKRMVGTTMVMAATYMLQMFDLIFLTTKGGPGTATMNLPLLLYRTAMAENNYGYANAVGVVIIVLGMLSMGIINKALRVNATDD